MHIIEPNAVDKVDRPAVPNGAAPFRVVRDWTLNAGAFDYSFWLQGGIYLLQVRCAQAVRGLWTRTRRVAGVACLWHATPARAHTHTHTHTHTNALTHTLTLTQTLSLPLSLHIRAR